MVGCDGTLINNSLTVISSHYAHVFHAQVRGIVVSRATTKGINVKISVQSPVNASAQALFSVVTDLENCARIVSGITDCEVLTDGPVGEGTRWRETRVMFGREATEEMEITAFDPPRSYEVSADSHGTRYVTTITVSDNGDTSILEYSFTGTPHSFVAKLMTPLGWFMKGATRKALEQHVADLKKAAESTARTS